MRKILAMLVLVSLILLSGLLAVRIYGQKPTFWFETTDGKMIQAQPGGLNNADGSFTPMTDDEQHKLDARIYKQQKELIWGLAARGEPDSFHGKIGEPKSKMVPSPSDEWKRAFRYYHGMDWKPGMTVADDTEEPIDDHVHVSEAIEMRDRYERRISDLERQIKNLQDKIDLLLSNQNSR